MPYDDALGRRSLLLAFAGGLTVLVALHLWQGLDYWTYSEGVYALTARLWLHGADIYGSLASAQPPGIFVVGRIVLGVHDSLPFLRGAIGLVSLCAGLVAAQVTWRLSGSRAAAVAAPALLLLTPWAVHEHGSLTPEPLAVLPLLAGALLASRSRTAALGGAVAALAVALKLPFLLPLAGIVVCAADRRRAAAGAVVTVVVLAVVSFAAFGKGLPRDVVTAQLDTGRHPLGVLPGIFGQAGWNLAGLLVPAAALLWLRRDDPLGRAWIGLSAGLLATVLTTTKTGTSLNILVPVEAALVPPALALVARRPVAALGVAFTIAQTVALIAFPARTLTPFVYPLSQRGAYGRVADDHQVRALARAAAACPPGVAYPGTPFVAFVARRPPVGGQPDGFLTARSSALAAARRAIAADTARCP